MNYCQCNNNITNSSNTNVAVTRLSSDNVPKIIITFLTVCIRERGRERGRGGEREKGVQ